MGRGTLHLMLVAAAVVACESSAEPPPQLSESRPRIRTSPYGVTSLLALGPALHDGEGRGPSFPLRIFNDGVTPLVIDSIDVLQPEGGHSIEVVYEALRADVSPSRPCPELAGFSVLRGEGCVVQVVLDTVGEGDSQAGIEIRSNDPERPVVSIGVDIVANGGMLAVDPDGDVVFEDVLQGEELTQTVRLTNVGNVGLVVHQIDLVNNANGDFKVSFSADSAFSSLPATLAPQDEDSFIEVDVTYGPQHAGQDDGEIRIRSDDLQWPERVVSLVAKSIFPCVQINPVDIDFRQVLIGTADELTFDITNCGNADLEITGLQMVEGSSADFAVTSGLEGLSEDCLHGGEDACTGSAIIAGNDTRTVLVRYAPADEGADGGRVAVHTTVTGQEAVEVNLFGRGTDSQPPTCLAEARVSGMPDWGLHPSEHQLLETLPLKTIELNGDNSRHPTGIIAAYQWTVLERPDDSTARILPHEGAPQSTFFLDLPGLYVFELEVTDNYGLHSSPNCQVWVEAIPDEDITVQLGWASEAGLDLHLLRAGAGWFCEPDDIWRRHPTADWGVPDDASDDPLLSAEDREGAGPELIRLNHPGNGQEYRVGVHWADDQPQGSTPATVRVFIQGRLRGEFVRMIGRPGQFWEVATVDWPDGSITPIERLHDSRPALSCE